MGIAKTSLSDSQDELSWSVLPNFETLSGFTQTTIMWDFEWSNFCFMWIVRKESARLIFVVVIPAISTNCHFGRKRKDFGFLLHNVWISCAVCFGKCCFRKCIPQEFEFQLRHKFLMFWSFDFRRCFLFSCFWGKISGCDCSFLA